MQFFLLPLKKKKKQLQESGTARLLRQAKKKGWGGVWGVRVLEHIIYQFANQLKSVNSGAGAARSALLIPHQCSPFM